MPDPGGSSSDRSSIPEPDSALGIEIGAVIAGKYRVERVIGKGGMGVVVAASQPELARTVAIKLIRSDSSDDRSAMARLLREAKAAASIQSEHVARVLDVGTLDSGVPFIVMEYLEGSDLQTLLDRDGALRPSDAVDYLLQACEAIAEAHRNGIVHRDLKPANLFIARLPGGRPCVKVVDFGISKAIGRETGEPLTQPASVVGSLYHMAPEQMRGGPVDARTDVWALGLLLYEMLSGRKPFGNQAWPAVAAQVLSDGPLLPTPIDGVSDELSAVVQKCLSRAPQQRYGTVAELAVALSRFGSRKAHLSLERIVLLATSTGSLSALALEPTEPARDSVPAFYETRPVPGGGFSGGAAAGFAPVPLSRSSAATPAGATPATPFPVSTGPRPGAASPSRFRAVLGAAAALALLASALFWAWPSSPEPAESERRAPLQPLVPVPAASADGERFERVERENPAVAEAPGGMGGPTLAPNAAGGAAATTGTAAAASTAGAASAGATSVGAGEAGHRSTAERPAAGTRGAASTNGAAPTHPSTSVTSSNASERAPEPPSPPRAPPKPPAKPSSPWDLHDIEFRDEAKP
jgi:eukaryotic-like serine/threonine-protein kinase